MTGPKRWAPAELEVEGRRFQVQADGRVYERRARGPERKSEVDRVNEAQLRRVRDRALIERVHGALQELREREREKRRWRYGMIRALGMDSKGGGPPPPDPAA